MRLIVVLAVLVGLVAVVLFTWRDTPIESNEARESAIDLDQRRSGSDLSPEAAIDGATPNQKRSSVEKPNLNTEPQPIPDSESPRNDRLDSLSYELSRAYELLYNLPTDELEPLVPTALSIDALAVASELEQYFDLASFVPVGEGNNRKYQWSEVSSQTGIRKTVTAISNERAVGCELVLSDGEEDLVELSYTAWEVEQSSRVETLILEVHEDGRLKGRYLLSLKDGQVAGIRGANARYSTGVNPELFADVYGVEGIASFFQSFRESIAATLPAE